MKIEVKKGFLWQFVSVTFNGEKLDKCFYADEDEGIVGIYIDREKTYKSGRVEIHLSDNAPELTRAEFERLRAA